MKEHESPFSSASQMPQEVLILTPSDSWLTLSILQIDTVHQDMLLDATKAHVSGMRQAGEVRNSAFFRGIKGGNLAILTQWKEQQNTSRAFWRAFLPPEQDVYRVVVVDQTTGSLSTHITPKDQLFHFMNVFQLASGKQDDFVESFQQTISLVRVQPGYVSTTLLLSRDSRFAAHIGVTILMILP